MIRLRTALLAVALPLAAACDRSADDELSAHGTVEIRELDVSASMASRVVQVLVDEGDSVSTGDTLAVLSQPTLSPDIAAREARLTTAQAYLRDLEAGARAPELERARAELRAATAEAERTARDHERMRALAEAGAVSRQELDAAATLAATAASRRDAAADALALLEAGSRPEAIRAARGEVANARAALEGARATAADLVLTSPASGVVMGRHADPGEMLAAGRPVVTIGQTTEPWVRVYVAAEVLPELAVGQAVVVTVPGLPRDVPGRITAINDRAEFTPRVALTEDERADQMFGVKIEVRGEPSLKPGMPATVRFGAAVTDTAATSPASP
jgi:HlyD family secretion protein